MPTSFLYCARYFNINIILVYPYSYKTKWPVDITWTVIPFSIHKLFGPYCNLNKIALNSFFWGGILEKFHIENLGQVMR